MKKLTKIAVLLLALSATIFTACKPEPIPEPVDPFKDAKLEASLVGTDKASGTISIDAAVIKFVGYVIEPTASKGNYTAAQIFEKENLVTLEAEGATQVTFSGLTPDTEYTVQLAGRINKDSVWEQVETIEFTTEMRDPILTAEVGTVAATEASFVVTTDNISRFAYLVKRYDPEAKAPKIPTIFATGTVVKAVAGQNEIALSELSPNTEYVVYIAGEIAGKEEFFENVVTLTGLKTIDFTDQVTIRDLNYRGFKVDLKVDPQVKANNHVIKWGLTDIVMYNNNYFGGLMNNAMGGATVGSMINLNDRFYHNFVNESTTFNFNEMNSYIFDELGNYTGASYYEAMVPGQPEVLMFGEYEWGDIEAYLGYSYGTPEQNLGYYIPLFKWTQYAYAWERRKDTWEEVDEAAYWTGFFHKEIVEVQKPEPLAEDAFNLTITTSPRDAYLDFEVKATEVERISLMVLEEENYQKLMPYLNNNEDYLQWFTTSITGMYAVSSFTFSPWYDANGVSLGGKVRVKLSELFYNLYRQYNYRVFAVALAGDVDGDGYLDGNKQCYKTFEFQLPEATKPAPEITITPVEELTTPYKVAYNIKCNNVDLESATYAVNSKKEWDRAGYTIEQILEMNSQYSAYNFNAAMLMQMQSENGYTLEFVANPEEELGLAIMAVNDEGTKGFSEVCYNTALEEEAPARVESELFESLKGTWTATTSVLTVQTTTDEETGEEVNTIVPVTRSCEVVVGGIEYPETLPEEVYELYESAVKADRETTDGYYAEFKAAADKENENIRKWNRILMNGFNFEAEDVPYYNYQSAFDLFCSSTYNGESSTSPVVDFGPKWYLEIAEDGSVSVPFNISYFDPMSSWYYDSKALYESHLVGYDYENSMLVGYFGNAERYYNGNFPVEISEDGNTITIKPLIYTYQSTEGAVEYTFYPSPAINYGGGQLDPLEICGNIVLTRGGGAVAPALAPSKAGKNSKSDHSVIKTDMKVKERSRVHARSNFDNLKPINEVKVKKYNSREEAAADFWKGQKVR